MKKLYIIIPRNKTVFLSKKQCRRPYCSNKAILGKRLCRKHYQEMLKQKEIELKLRKMGS